MMLSWGAKGFWFEVIIKVSDPAEELMNMPLCANERRMEAAISLG